jgi:predicted nucleotidyltransferase
MRLSKGPPSGDDGAVMHTLVQQHRDEIADLCRRFGVRRLEVFGSAARGVDFDPATSDVDFLVAFDAAAGKQAWTQVMDLKAALEDLLRRPVDLVERGAVESSRNYIRRQNILADAQAVYG